MNKPRSCSKHGRGARGLTVLQLLADLACTYEALPPDLAELRDRGEGPWSPQILEEDERRLAEFKHTREGVSWEEVKSWMQSWGTPHELPAPKPANMKLIISRAAAAE